MAEPASDVAEFLSASSAQELGEEHFRAMVENIGDVVSLFDRNCRFLYLNQTGLRLAGMPAEAFIGKTHADVGFAPEAYEPWERIIRHVFETGLAEEHDFTVDFPCGRRLMHWRVSPDIGEDGRVRRVLTVARDMTESRQAARQLEAYSRRLQEMARRMVQAQEAERYEIAGDLHDLLGQNLTALGINLDIVRYELPEGTSPQIVTRMVRMKAIVDETIESVRVALKELRPPSLDDYGLVAALHSFANHFTQDRQFSVAVGTRGPEARMAPEVELALFRIVQEAVANASRHSGAKAVRVELESEPGRLRLVVQDDGRGFRTDVERRAGTRSIGLMLMQERADAIGANLIIESAPGTGTRVAVEMVVTGLQRGNHGLD